MTLFTIGFTHSSAEHFFGRLKAAGVRKVVDIRLHNSSQLAGFAKSDDLAFFLKALGSINYVHDPSLAPSEDIFTAYKKQKGDWSVFRVQYLGLMQARGVERAYSPSDLDGACLLCSEPEPHHCHRRLLSDYLNDRWSTKLEIEDL